jgi:hypothetical protein
VNTNPALVKANPSEIEQANQIPQAMSPREIADPSERAKWLAEQIRQRLRQMRDKRDATAMLRPWLNDVD